MSNHESRGKPKLELLGNVWMEDQYIFYREAQSGHSPARGRDRPPGQHAVPERRQLQHQLAVFHVYHNFMLPHAGLRQPLLIPEPTNGTGSAKRWRPCTPVMAAGLTDHGWTLQEVLLYRVPPWPQPAGV